MSTRTTRIITYLTIIVVEILIIMLITQIAWARSVAPGATTAPGQSRIGKPAQPDPGGSMHADVFFKHYAFSQDETKLKLIPRSRRITRMYMDGQIIFGIHVWGKCVFNIILIISLWCTIYSLAWLSTFYPQSRLIISYSKVGNLSEIGIESLFWTVHSACCAVCSHGTNKYVGYSCRRFLTTINL